MTNNECRVDGCTHDAYIAVYWPGKQTLPYCRDHMNKARSISRGIGSRLVAPDGAER